MNRNGGGSNLGCRYNFSCASCVRDLTRVPGRATTFDLVLRSLPEGQHNFFLGAGRVPEVDLAVSEMGAWLRSKIGLTLATA